MKKGDDTGVGLDNITLVSKNRMDTTK